MGGSSKRSARRRHARMQKRARKRNAELAERNVPPNARPRVGPADAGGFLRGVMRQADEQ